MTSPLRALRAAFVFLTRVPVGGFPYAKDEWHWASAFFPVVGACVGAAVAAAFRLLAPLGPAGAAVLAIAISLLLTGGFHEDGLADTSDALGGAADREKVFVILKDSRVGTFGASALVVSITGRAALLARLDAHAAWGLVFVGAIARAAPVWQMVALPYATPEGAKSRDVARAGSAQALIATGSALAVGAGLVGAHVVAPWRVVAAIVVCTITAIATALRYWRRVGGVTGDFLGATEQLCELAALATIAWAGAT